ncbi:MAG TPA: hypothetical protein VM618_08270 [Acidimicrobiia bacterium]|nr:hypothetical protein [Acidimicrobiia bacterium]
MRVRRVLAASLIVATGLFIAPASPVAHAHEGTYPILLVHGWTSNGATFDEMIPKLQANGLTVLDCDSSKAGTQAMSYAPTASGQHIPYIVGKIVQPKIDQCLTANGYSTSQKIDIVAHSMGGVVSRFLVEKGGADVDYWSNSTGWYGDGTPDVSTKWKNQVDDLIMLGTPNHGAVIPWVPSNLPQFFNWQAAGTDMVQSALFLQKMGYAEPAGEYYTCIGGDPSYLQVPKYDYDGDGVGHGWDGIVAAESPFLTGCNNFLTSSNHSGLRTDDAPLDLVIQELGYTSNQTGTGGADLAGQAIVELEYFSVANDHDANSTDEYRFEVQVDADGNNDGYTTVETLAYDRDGPFTQNWDENGPGTSVAINLPGTSPRMDVRIRIWEDDTSWGGGQEAVSTHTFTDILQSDDIDGWDYYSAKGSDSEGGTNTVRISVNGVTASPENTRLMTFGFDKAYIQDELEPSGNGEVQFTLNAGRKGFESTFYRGDPGTDTHYSRSAGTWVNIGTNAKNNGQVESETIWTVRMVNSATYRFDLTYWEDDGGWSGRDGGQMYYREAAVGSQPAGRTNYSGTSHSHWDVYLYVVAEG